jgi:hypothetical protein
MTILLNGQDYTSALANTPPLTIARTLNRPSQCAFCLELATGPLPVPLRNQSVQVTADNGTVLFTGYIVSDAVQQFAGDSTAGAVYLTHIAAWSEEYALDRQPLPWLTGTNDASSGVAQGAGTILSAITDRLATQQIATAGIGAGPTIGFFRPEPGTAWSHSAGQLAAAARCAYKVVQGTLSLTPVGSVTHTLDGTQLSATSVEFKSNRILANDVTLTGEEEPDCYALDLFQGDGATTEFDLTRGPFAVKGQTLVEDAFLGSAINTQTWQIADPGSHLTLLSSAGTGLSITGGTGSDGQTTLCAIDPVELGGTLVVEAGNVMFAAGSDGIVCGLYSGLVDLADCFAGFRVRTTDGALVLAPLINGVETGTAFTMTANHAYLVRIRLHFPELIRSLATYYSVGPAGVIARGGGLVDSACSIEFELQDSASAANTPATVLYDGKLAASPATATFGAVNSTNLQGSIGYFSVKRPSTAWVTSVPAGGTERTRRIGLAAEGAECKVSAGKLIKLRYRTSRRSVARLADAASEAAEASGQPANGVTGVAQWAGRVEKPVARCSADCEAAAQAVLDFSTSRDAAWEARATAANLHQQATGDVWPGDLVSMAAPFAAVPAPATFVIRTVTIRDGAARPELLNYSLGLANEWADCLSLALHDVPAADALLPQLPASAADAVAENLPLVDVTALTSAALTVAVNATPPAGGGFEVRRQDAGFGNGTQTGVSSQGLVLRSAVATFSLPRAAEIEQFFVRMYDGSTPPLYSRASAAIFTDVPLS